MVKFYDYIYVSESGKTKQQKIYGASLRRAYFRAG
jgi:hypothetical protein